MNDRETLDQVFADAVRERVDNQYENNQPHMVINWMIIATLVDKEGERLLYFSSTEDLRSWERLGMLEFASAEEKNTILLNRMNEK